MTTISFWKLWGYLGALVFGALVWSAMDGYWFHLFPNRTLSDRLQECCFVAFYLAFAWLMSRIKD